MKNEEKIRKKIEECHEAEKEITKYMYERFASQALLKKFYSVIDTLKALEWVLEEHQVV